MAYFLTVHTRYKDIALGVYQDSKIIKELMLESRLASKLLLISIDRLLHDAGISLDALAFIGVHQGPAPFTTLRVTMATMNGIAFASGIPLIGVNGLEAFIDEQPHETDYTLVLLNAYSNDVYYALYDRSASAVIEIGYSPAGALLKKYGELYAGSFSVIGNAVILHASLLEESFGKRAHLYPHADMASLDAIAQSAYRQYTDCAAVSTQQLLPLYLKNWFGVTPL